MCHTRVAEHAAPDIAGVPGTRPVTGPSLNGMSPPPVRALIVVDANAVRARAPFRSRVTAAVYGQYRRCKERHEGKEDREPERKKKNNPNSRLQIISTDRRISKWNFHLGPSATCEDPFHGSSANILARALTTNCGHHPANARIITQSSTEYLQS
ncbi:hypothetical protein AJ78_04383 [Emergomyces pasteurianus Ep9510]|uniref:Uncharacterized protein n=1 Tax=Emergomyces pasteurianus Ep9510 TaxID=1447872 RepID=A0A1J9PHF6_9EURO|nr:hypothetical protein AJ78_04383 [Emergomyces pasteurianus Ep9510]